MAAIGLIATLFWGQLQSNITADITAAQSSDPNGVPFVIKSSRQFETRLRFRNTSSPLLLPLIGNVKIYLDYILAIQDKNSLAIRACLLPSGKWIPDFQLNALAAGTYYDFLASYKDKLDKLVEIQARLNSLSTLRLLRIRTTYENILNQAPGKFNKYFILSSEDSIWDLHHEINGEVSTFENPEQPKSAITAKQLMSILDRTEIPNAFDSKCDEYFGIIDKIKELLKTAPRNTAIPVDFP